MPTSFVSPCGDSRSITIYACRFPCLRLENQTMADNRNAADVQTTLDDWLDANPVAQKYVTKLYYLPDGAEIPADVTHVNRLAAKWNQELDLRIGVVATPETAAVADLILAKLNRGDERPKGGADPTGRPRQ